MAATETMTSHLARLYAVALALVIFFLSWAAVAARPWGTEQSAAASSPQAAALDRRAKRLKLEQIRVQALLDRRFAEYRARLKERRRQIARIKAAPVVSAPISAPSVGTVSLPPVTSTKSS
jgi:hypothetical protein